MASFEAYFGRSAFAHLFVTQAMRDHLVKEWDLRYENALMRFNLSLTYMMAVVKRWSFMIGRLLTSRVLRPLRCTMFAFDSFSYHLPWLTICFSFH